MSKSGLRLRYLLGGGALILICAGLALAQSWWPPKPPRGYNIFNEQQESWLGEILADEQKLGDHGKTPKEVVSEKPWFWQW